MEQKLVDMSVIKQAFDRIRKKIPDGMYVSIDVGLSSYSDDESSISFEYSVYTTKYGATTSENLDDALARMFERMQNTEDDNKGGLV